jgi:hypothetical protein
MDPVLAKYNVTATSVCISELKFRMNVLPHSLGLVVVTWFKDKV